MECGRPVKLVKGRGLDGVGRVSRLLERVGNGRFPIIRNGIGIGLILQRGFLHIIRRENGKVGRRYRIDEEGRI